MNDIQYFYCQDCLNATETADSKFVWCKWFGRDMYAKSLCCQHFDNIQPF